MKKILTAIRNNYSDIYKIFLFLVTLVILLILSPKGKQFRYEFHEGSPWLYEDLVAPVDFPIQKSQKEIDKEINDINNNTRLYFQYDTELSQQITNTISSKFDTLWLHYYGFGERNLYAINKELCLNLSSEILEVGLLPNSKFIQNIKNDKVVYIVQNKVAKETFLNFFYTSKTSYLHIKEKADKTPGAKVDFVLNFLSDILKPNIIYDKEKTETEKQIKLTLISPNKGMILAGQHIISKGEIIDAKTYKILQSLKSDYLSKSLDSMFELYIGKIILISVPLFTFGLFLFFFMPKILEDTRNLIMIFILIIIMVAITRLVVEIDSNYVLIIPLMLSPIIIRAFFDSSLALIIHITTVILVSFNVPNSFLFLFIQIMTGLITITSIVKLQKRSQFFLTALYIFLSYSVIFLGIELVTEGHLSAVRWQGFLFFAISAVLTLFASPIIYLFESLFGKVTDVSLLEYADTNNSLIRELSNKAPGTFHHCIQVSNLAEEAAVEVNANALLVRAGAMYHDIGKMLNPIYFTENQSGDYSPHDELSYEESAEIIIGHVLAGIKLAKEKKLPNQIIDFIRTHHGTKRVEYFYRMHKREFPDEKIKLSTFTYHGPIPYSKETCILMMADAVEAASKSIKSPNAKSISELVDAIIKSQLDQGQFNNADISLREINTIKKVFKRKLLNMYHLRIEYPEEN